MTLNVQEVSEYLALYYFISSGCLFRFNPHGITQVYPLLDEPTPSTFITEPRSKY